MSNVLVLQRGGVPLEGYRAFHSPDELARRRRALALGNVAPVIQLKADRPKAPAGEEDPRQGR